MNRYCLDTNVLIEPWNKYYSMDLCPEYWEVLDDLAKKDIIFCAEEVRRELERVDDRLSEWAKARSYLFRSVTKEVQVKLRDILRQFPRLVDTIKDRSMADPWVKSRQFGYLFSIRPANAVWVRKGRHRY